MTETERERDRDRDRETDRDRDRETDRQTDRQIDRQTDRDRETERDRERDRDRDRQTERVCLHSDFWGRSERKKYIYIYIIVLKKNLAWGASVYSCGCRQVLFYAVCKFSFLQSVHSFKMEKKVYSV